MWSLLKQNRLYFLTVTIYFLICIVLLFTINKGDAIFFFSENRSSFGDTFFQYATTFGEEWVYVALVLLLSFVRFRLALLIPLLGFMVMIISSLSKSLFSHHRPIAYFKQQGLADQLNLIEGIHLYSGQTSFPSGHTMSAFAIYTFLALSLKQKNATAILIALMAIIVGISRIYLVQHFLEDITLGALIGVLLAILLYYFQSFWKYKPKYSWLDRSFNYKKTTKQA